MSTIVAGNIPLVPGQQSYVIAFATPFSTVPDSFFAQVQMVSSSGEIFDLNPDRSTLTGNGVTVWLSGIPTSASIGSVINYRAEGIPVVTPGPTQGTGISVVQLFHRIGRRGRTADSTRLSMDELLDIAEAVNSALQTVYNNLPIYFKEQTQGFALPGPLAVTGVGVTQFGKTITGLAFTAAQFGQTVVLEGDAAWNQITGTNSLLNPYMGATGTVGGTIYGNALFTDKYPLDRIIGDPQFADQSTWNMIRAGMWRGNGTPNWFYQQSVGRPVTWWTQTFGQDQGASPFVCLRFAPAPDQPYSVNVRIGLWPKRITLADYQNAVMMVVPDQFIEPCLIPLALAAFMTTPSWKVSGMEKNVTANALTAIQFLKDQPGQIGAPSNRVFTPVGY